MKVNRNTAHFIRGDGTPRTWERRSTTNQREDRVSVVKDSKIRIFPVRETEPELRKTLPDWFQREFGTTGFTWAAPAHYAISEIGGELIGRLGIFDRVIEIADTSMRVGGIGGVITKPEWRQRGIARELLTRAAAFMSGELGVQSRSCFAGARWRRCTRSSDGFASTAPQGLCSRLGWRLILATRWF